MGALRAQPTSRWLVLATVVAVAGLTAKADQPRGFRYPLSCAGVRIGSTLDSTLVKMYGRGLYVKHEDHLGGRYYVDARRRITLHLGVGTDEVIDLVELSQGIHVPAGTPHVAVRRARSLKAFPSGVLGAQVGLGTPLARVLGAYGKPTSMARTGRETTVRYVSSYRVGPGTIPYQAAFRFVRGRLVRIVIYNGDLW